MAEHGRSRRTSASPEAVWRLWSDPSSWHEWNPGVRRMTLNGPFADNTTGVMETPAGRRHDVQLTNIRPGRSFDLQTAVIPLTRFTFHCEVVPSGTGSSISQSIRVAGPLGFVVSPLMGDRIAATFEPLLEGLARKAEASPTVS